MPSYPPNATFTPRLQLPRPGLDDLADGPDGFNDLTDVLDPIAAVYATGTTAARPAAGIAGRFYWSTDELRLYYDDGAAWRAASGAATIATALPILDVGVAGQNRAGRQLAVADFTSLGLAQPIGLWNLSGLTNLGSDGQAFANKGAVPFGVGINGAAATAAVFAGSASQALYIAGASAANYNIRTGSWGCWVRTAKRGVLQVALSKMGTAGTNAVLNFHVSITSTNVVTAVISDGTTAPSASGVSDIADDRWHHVVATHDGTSLRIYVDGALEGVVSGPLIQAGAFPLNIGGYGADAGTNVPVPGAFYGRVDEAFVCGDVLSEDQVRCLYAARLTHTLGVVPTGVRLNVTRRRKGGLLAVADFTTQPIHLYNFTAGSLTDQGSGNVALTNNGAAISVAGADGRPAAAFSFAGAQSLSATDTGLPNLLTTRSYGCWFKTSTLGQSLGVMGWGTNFSADTSLRFNTSGVLICASGADQITGPFLADGQWHQAIVVEDNAAGDGVRRKFYIDARLVGGSTVINSVTLAGANSFRLGANAQGSQPFVGQIDRAFVCAYALDIADVARLYAKGSQALAASPKNAGDHVEALESAGVLFIADTLNSQDTVDLGVVA